MVGRILGTGRNVAVEVVIVKLIDRLAASMVVNVVLTTLVYVFYAVLIGISLVPSLYLVFLVYTKLIEPSFRLGVIPGLGRLVVFACSLGVALFLFFFVVLIVIGLFSRLLAIGLKPGRYKGASLMTLRWMVLNGAFIFAYTRVLPIVPATFFSIMFFRLTGARIGKNVWINTHALVDSYLLTVGDNTLIGGEAVLACHTYEDGYLVLGRIEIGRDCMIGTRAYINPDVAVGNDCIVGAHTVIRSGTKIEPGTILTSIAGLPVETVRDIERGRILPRKR